MLADLKIVEDNLHNLQSMDKFLEKYKILDIIKLLNKSKKQQTQTRIKYFFSKLSQSNNYKMFLMAALQESKENKQEFQKYLKSQNSEEYFTMIQNKQHDILGIMEFNPQIIPFIFECVKYEYGVKMIKLFKKLYEGNSQKYKCLFTEQIKKQLIRGIGLQSLEDKQFVTGIDTIAQMRYVEIIANIAILGGKCFQFVAQILDKALNLYLTQDFLLKMNLIEIISILGQGFQTSAMLKDHKVWKYIQKDATNVDQQFYIRKHLLILLVQMSSQGHFQMSVKLNKDLVVFIKQNIMKKGEYQEAALDIISHLLKNLTGTKLVVQNSQIFNAYIMLSRSSQDSIKKAFLNSLICLTFYPQSSGSKSAKQGLVINILNCLGNPSLATGLTHNLHSNTIMIQGLEDFCKWYTAYLALPFEDLQMKVIQIFINLLNYREVIQTLLQNQESTKYLLKPKNVNNSDKILRSKKNQLIMRILERGTTQWKGTELQEYCRMLQKQLKNQKMQVQYALDVE